MPVGAIGSGIAESFAEYVKGQRDLKRQQEDAQLDQHMQLIKQLADRPDANPALLGQALHDLADMAAAKGGRGPLKKGGAGFMGAHELPISQFLQGIQDGTRPVIGPTQEPNAPSPVMGQPKAAGMEGSQPQPLPAKGVPTDMMAPMPGEATGDLSTTVSAKGSPAPPQGPQMPTGEGVLNAPIAMPPAGIQGPPTASRMLSAGRQIQTDQQVNPPQAQPKMAKPPAEVPDQGMRPVPDEQQPYFRSHKEMAEMAGQTQGITEGAKKLADIESRRNEVRLMRQSGIPVSQEEEKRYVMYGGTAGMSAITQTNGPKVKDAEGNLHTTVYKKDKFGNNQLVEGITGEQITPDKYTPVEDTQLETDKTGAVTSVGKVSGKTSSIGGGKPIGKPQIPPPAFSGQLTVSGPNGEPQPVQLPRGGGPAVPVTVKGAPGEPPTPATKFVPPKYYSPAAATVFQSTQMVKFAGEQAKNIIDQLEKKGVDMNTPISQTLELKGYQWGWPNADKLEDNLIQTLGVTGVNGMKLYMGGRPNQKLIDIIKIHLPEPGDSLLLAKRKLEELDQISGWMDQAVARSESMTKQLPWEKSKGNIPPPPMSGAAPKKSLSNFKKP